MSEYGRKWEEHRQGIASTMQRIETETGKTFESAQAFRLYVLKLRDLLHRLETQEHYIDNIKESDR